MCCIQTQECSADSTASIKPRMASLLFLCGSFAPPPQKKKAQVALKWPTVFTLQLKSQKVKRQSCNVFSFFFFFFFCCSCVFFLVMCTLLSPTNTVHVCMQVWAGMLSALFVLVDPQHSLQMMWTNTLFEYENLQTASRFFAVNICTQLLSRWMLSVQWKQKVQVANAARPSMIMSQKCILNKLYIFLQK